MNVGVRQLFFFNDSFAKFFNAISQRRIFRSSSDWGATLGRNDLLSIGPTTIPHQRENNSWTAKLHIIIRMKQFNQKPGTENLELRFPPGNRPHGPYSTDLVHCTTNPPPFIPPPAGDNA